jgi:hypothetical protein
VSTSNASHYSSEKRSDEGLNFVNFTNFQNLLKLSKEKSFFHTVSKRPVLEKPFKQGDSEVSIFSKEKH